MAPADTISFARGAPSLDIIDVEELKEAAQRAFVNDPAGATAYGPSIGATSWSPTGRCRPTRSCSTSSPDRATR
jgi:hypothetical protein